MEELRQIKDLSNIKILSQYRMPQSVLIIGCGGTGAYVAGHLARLISVLNKSPYVPYGGFHLTLADGDKVEQKNLERQHFIYNDLETNKAEALAARYSSAFGIEIQAITKYLENAETIKALDPDLIIGCVDNNASRCAIYSCFFGDSYFGERDRFWIDSGNEENSGQVICGYAPRTYGGYRYYEFSLPMVTEVYPEIISSTKKFNSELSCAELAESAPQNMMTNITAATIILNFSQKILRQKELRSHGVIFSVDNAFKTLLNTPENLAKVNPDRLRSWEKTK